MSVSLHAGIALYFSYIFYYALFVKARDIPDEESETDIQTV